jgi:hypothetical protein
MGVRVHFKIKIIESKMSKVFLSGPILALSLFTAIANSEPSDQLSATKKEEPKMLGRRNEIKRQTALATGAITAP